MTRVDGDFNSREIDVHLAIRSNARLECPHCQKRCPRYDKTHRRWRHLDTSGIPTFVQADVPRVKCDEHGVSLIHVPWSEPGVRYTVDFEVYVTNWLLEASVLAVSRQTGLSWNAIAGIQQRAVSRGLARRDATEQVLNIGIDETSYRKGHEYVSIVHDGDTGAVMHVCEDRKKDSVAEFYETLSDQQRSGIRSISMDMWPAFIGATLEAIPDAMSKIAFDKFHVAKYLGDAVDHVRKQEHRMLLQEGNDLLKRTKYSWLTNPENEDVDQAIHYRDLRNSQLKTARAWAIKEHAMCLWGYARRAWAEKSWLQWYGWAIRSQLAPVKKAARTIKTHLWGIINAVVLDVDNSLAESINSKVQKVKRRGCGFRSKERFKMAIYFHLGKLDLYPAGYDHDMIVTHSS